MFQTRLLAPHILRITHHLPNGDFPVDRPWLEHILCDLSQSDTALPSLKVVPERGTPQIFTPTGDWLCGEAAPPSQDENYTRPTLSVDIPKVEVRLHLQRVTEGIRLKLKIQPGESFYGFGEWFNGFRRQSGTLEMNIRDAIAPLQSHETYSSIPCFLSSRGYAFFLLNSHASRWAIRPEQGILDISAAGPAADYVIIYGPSFKEILFLWTQLTGRPPLLPRWAFGLFVTGYPQEDQATVLERVRQHRQRQIPLDSVILDYHWEEHYHNFRWRTSLFPTPDAFIADLRQLGIRLGLITTPFINARQRPWQKAFLKALAANLPPGLEHDDERALPEYFHGLSAGYFAHPDALWWFGAGGMLDFTNEDAANWWNELLRPLYIQGAAFFKNDDGEYLPEDATCALKITGSELHNLYGFFYGRAMYNGMLDLPGNSPARRPFIYARTVWAGSQRHPALFLGDQKPTFEHIRRTMRAGLNLGLLGFAYWTADVFGLDGKTTPETHMRYAQWALLNPVARYFWRPPHVDNTRFPWSHHSTAEENFRSYTGLRYRLLPYFQTLAWQAWQTGLPLVRPLLLEYPQDTRFADLSDQYLLGADILIAPVTEASAVTRPVLLPEGIWHDFWSSQSWQGPDKVSYIAPLDRLPILVRGSSLVPMGPLIQHIPDNHRFDTLELHAWPPFSAHLDFYEDDGLTLDYQQGAYTLTTYSLETLNIHDTAHPEAMHLVFTAQPTHGSFDEQPTARQITLILHRSASPYAVTLNGSPCSTWDHDHLQGETHISLSCPLESRTQLWIDLLS